MIYNQIKVGPQQNQNQIFYRGSHVITPSLTNDCTKSNDTNKVIEALLAFDPPRPLRPYGLNGPLLLLEKVRKI